MPRSKSVKVIIGVDGACRIDALNFSDASCQTATQEIIAALAGRVIQQHLKPEARVRQRCTAGESEPAR